ncbi:MAG: hypothetical protein IPH80_33340 [Myxococcales bacterium]|nr:hypothetical protein [Myxococcales bacterium]
MAQEQERDPQPATGEAKRAHRSLCSISATMQPQRWSGVVAVAIGLATTTTASTASAGEAVALAYQPPPGCPGADALREGVVQRLGPAAIAERAPVTIAVAIAAHGDAWQVVLAVHGDESPGDRPERVATCDAAMDLAIRRVVELVSARAAIRQAEVDGRRFVPRGRIAMGAGAAAELFDGFGDLTMEAEVGTAGARTVAAFVRIVEGSEPNDGWAINRTDVSAGVQGCASWRWLEGCVRLGGDRWSQSRQTSTYIGFRQANWGFALGARVSAVAPLGEHFGVRVGVLGAQRTGYDAGIGDFTPWQRGYGLDAAGLLWF